MVQVWEKYKSEVSFIGLTSATKESVDAFVTSRNIPWPIGYEVAEGTVKALGAYADKSTNGRRSPGDTVFPPGTHPASDYIDDVQPVLYVIDPTGRIIWHDDHARPKHQPIDELRHDLESAIQQALNTNPKPN